METWARFKLWLGGVPRWIPVAFAIMVNAVALFCVGLALAVFDAGHEIIAPAMVAVTMAGLVLNVKLPYWHGDLITNFVNLHKDVLIDKVGALFVNNFIFFAAAAGDNAPTTPLNRTCTPNGLQTIVFWNKKNTLCVALRQNGSNDNRDVVFQIRDGNIVYVRHPFDQKPGDKSFNTKNTHDLRVFLDFFAAEKHALLNPAAYDHPFDPGAFPLPPHPQDSPVVTAAPPAPLVQMQLLKECAQRLHADGQSPWFQDLLARVAAQAEGLAVVLPLIDANTDGLLDHLAPRLTALLQTAAPLATGHEADVLRPALEDLLGRLQAYQNAARTALAERALGDARHLIAIADLMPDPLVAHQSV